MTLPNFIVIGAAKSGTTSLMSYLGQHPDVFVSASKEPNYFALAGFKGPPRGPAPAAILQAMLYNWSRTELPEYEALFAAATDQRAIGEGSVRYLYFPEAPGRIRAMIPDVRLIAILRDPVSRLYSHYNMNRQIQLEPLGLRAALAAEETRIADGWGWDWHYAAVSRYGEQLRRYYDLFPREQIAVFLYDDFVADPLGVHAQICRHIGVKPDMQPDMTKRGMVTTLPRNLWLDRRLNWPSGLRTMLLRPPSRRIAHPVIRRLNRLNSRPVPPLDPVLRRELAVRFRGDIAELSDMLGRDIPWYRGA
ncbi:MAG: sulfotransferase [Paracoccaceae bacterium]